jgi:hypothetical protein
LTDSPTTTVNIELPIKPEQYQQAQASSLKSCRDSWFGDQLTKGVGFAVTDDRCPHPAIAATTEQVPGVEQSWR